MTTRAINITTKNIEIIFDRYNINNNGALSEIVELIINQAIKCYRNGYELGINVSNDNITPELQEKYNKKYVDALNAFNAIDR